MKTKKINISEYLKLHDTQKVALQHIGHGEKLFYGGSRGGGKTRFALIAAILTCNQYAGITVVAIRRRHFQLEEAFIQQMLTYYPANVFGYVYRKQTKTASFKNGSRIVFRPCDNEHDTEIIQGIEFQLMIIDEANQFESITIDKLSGSLRVSTENIPSLKDFIPSLIMTGNPGGRSDLYFKTRYVFPDYKYWSDVELKHKDNYVFVRSRLEDNPSINQEHYRSQLEGIGDEKVRAAWLDGDWDAFHGQFFDEWNRDAHVISSFAIPNTWVKQTGMDMGFTNSHPSVVLWGAQDPKTQELHIYKELVMQDAIETQAERVKEMQEGEHIDIAWADPSMFDNTIRKKEFEDAPADIFAKVGIVLMRADNGRVNGWRALKQWLHWTKRKLPMLRIHDNCPQLINVMPTLRYNNRQVGHSEDMDTRQSNDDFGDALRYLVKSGFQYPIGEDFSTEEETEDVEYVVNNVGVKRVERKKSKRQQTNDDLIERFKSLDNFIDDNPEPQADREMKIFKQNRYRQTTGIII